MSMWDLESNHSKCRTEILLSHLRYLTPGIGAPILAHAGRLSWDEFALLAIPLVLAVIVVRVVERRRGPKP